MRRILVSGSIVALVVGVAFVAPASAAKKPRSCTILKPSQIAQVLDAEVGKAGASGTGGYACPFDLGAGLGEPGGGLVTVTYYSRDLAKSIWNATKARTEAIAGSKARFDAASEAAYLYKNGKLVGVSVTFTNNDPSTDELRPEMAELAELAARKL